MVRNGRSSADISFRGYPRFHWVLLQSVVKRRSLGDGDGLGVFLLIISQQLSYDFSDFESEGDSLADGFVVFFREGVLEFFLGFLREVGGGFAGEAERGIEDAPPVLSLAAAQCYQKGTIISGWKGQISIGPNGEITFGEVYGTGVNG